MFWFHVGRLGCWLFLFFGIVSAKQDFRFGRANSFKIEKERNVILFFSSSLSYVTSSLLIGHSDVGGVNNDVSDVAEQF